jgi:cytochrome c biogenesis protein CcdA
MAALLTVLASPRGLRAGFWFAAGYAAVVVILMALAMTVLSSVSYSSLGQHRVISGIGEIVLGVMLVAAAVGWLFGRRSRRRRTAVTPATPTMPEQDTMVPDDTSDAGPAVTAAVAVAQAPLPTPATGVAAATDGPAVGQTPNGRESAPARGSAPGRVKAWATRHTSSLGRRVQRLDRLPWYAVMGVGILLSVLRVRNLFAMLIVANAATAQGVSDEAAVVAAILFVVIALVPMWLPLTAFIVHRDRRDEFMASMRAWMLAHGALLGVFMGLALGLLLIGHGLMEVAGMRF